MKSAVAFALLAVTGSSLASAMTIPGTPVLKQITRDEVIQRQVDRVHHRRQNPSAVSACSGTAGNGAVFATFVDAGTSANPGTYLHTYTETTAFACARVCENYGTCQYAFFIPSSNNCALYSGAGATIMSNTGTDYIVAGMTCDAARTTFNAPAGVSCCNSYVALT